MQIILANPRGFCAGVKRALDTLEIVSQKSNVYVYNEIVHNTVVVKGFENKGVTFVKDLKKVPDSANLVLSAHGVAPVIKSQAISQNLNIVDATCPLVNKVHLEAINLAKNGYLILLIGHKGHDELIGTYGEALEHTKDVFVIETENDIDNLNLPADRLDKIAYLTQTTLSVDETYSIVSKLKQAFPNIIEPKTSDICYATSNRQQAVKQLIKEVECLIVVGSKNSSNTKRLFELAIFSNFIENETVFWVDCLPELDLEKLRQKDFVKIGITSGASVPESLVSEISLELVKTFDAEIIELEQLNKETTKFSLPVSLPVTSASEVKSCTQSTSRHCEG